MNMTQTTALLNQLRESRDIEAVLAGYQALTANHTTPLGLNQWQLSDKPTMEDFNRDNEIIDGKLRELDSSLGNKVNGKLKFITNLSDIGITTGSETMTGIFNAMTDNSVLLVSVGAWSNVSEYPTSRGILTVYRAGATYGSYEFVDHIGNQKWIGGYYTSFSGWKALTTVNGAYCKLDKYVMQVPVEPECTVTQGKGVLSDALSGNAKTTPPAVRSIGQRV